MAFEDAKRVAIVGAGGIGRYHAQWWTREKADICAIVGRTDSSTQAAARALLNLKVYPTDLYTDLSTMLDDQSPDIVDVCSPPEFHYAHVKTCLERGCHVLCEKPFVFSESWSSKESVERASELYDLAEGNGLMLSVCTQYAALVPTFMRLWKAERPHEKLSYFKAHLRTHSPTRLPEPGAAWFDLSSHLLSALFAAVPGCRVAWPTVITHFDGYGARGVFEVQMNGRDAIKCDIVTEHSPSSSRKVRYFQFNDCSFNVEGYEAREGVYRAQIATLSGHHIVDDPLHSTIAAFHRGAPIVERENAVATIQTMCRVAELATSAKGGRTW